MKYFFQDVDRNWRTGNYQIKIVPWDRNYRFRFKIEGDLITTTSLGEWRSVNRFRIINSRLRRSYQVSHLI